MVYPLYIWKFCFILFPFSIYVCLRICLPRKKKLVVLGLPQQQVVGKHQNNRICNQIKSGCFGSIQQLDFLNLRSNKH